MDLSGDAAGLTATDSPLTVAQVVLTITSVPGIDTVRLTRDYAPIDVPRANGSLTSELLTSDDYASLRPGGAGLP